MLQLHDCGGGYKNSFMEICYIIHLKPPKPEDIFMVNTQQISYLYKLITSAAKHLNQVNCLCYDTLLMLNDTE